MRWITANPEICHEKPTFKGTRILVSDVLEPLATGMSIKDILREYPQLNEEMIKEAIEYAGGKCSIRKFRMVNPEQLTSTSSSRPGGTKMR